MGTLSVVVGGQYGSESKGSVAAWLAEQQIRAGTGAVSQVAVRVAGPNAGHTVYDFEGNRFALRQIPVAAAIDHEAALVIAAGSEIDPPVLLEEIGLLEAAGHPVRHRLYIDPQATVIVPGHKVAERGLVGAIGSTGKGIGAARAERLLRNAPTWGEWLAGNTPNVAAVSDLDTSALLRTFAQANFDIVIEGTQGFRLGLHAGYYPQCTSSDCRAIDFLAMAGIAPWDAGITDFDVWVVVRAFPIRVAGNSGPMLDETTWQALGLPDEYTTVTQKVRRVGGWDDDLLLDAVEANGGPDVVKVAYAMADQRWPELAGLHGDWSDATMGATLTAAQRDAMSDATGEMARLQSLTDCRVEYLGTGPTTRLWVTP